MKRLVVLRHTKSSWDDPGFDDHDRPLAKRGRKAAEKLAGQIREHGPAPELVVCSTALRARETLAGVGRGLEADVPVQLDPGLYMASLQGLVGLVRKLPDEYDSVMLVGHNPGFHELVLHLADDLPDRVRDKLPTGALVTIDLDVRHWQDVRVGTGHVVGVVFPREL